MAVAKIGSIFSDLAGSIQGTTIRRDGSQLVVGSRAKAVNRQKLRDNPALAELRNYFNTWTFIDPSTKARWADAGSRLQFRNRFGDLVNYTGRQLYVSVNAGLEGTGLSLPDPADVTSVVATPEITNVDVNSSGLLECSLARTHIDAFAIWQVEIKDKGATAPNAKRYKKIAVLDASVQTFYDLTFFFRQFYSMPVQGRAVRVYCTLVNSTGFRSNQVSAFKEL